MSGGKPIRPARSSKQVSLPQQLCQHQEPVPWRIESIVICTCWQYSQQAVCMPAVHCLLTCSCAQGTAWLTCSSHLCHPACQKQPLNHAWLQAGTAEKRRKAEPSRFAQQASAPSPAQVSPSCSLATHLCSYVCCDRRCGCRLQSQRSACHGRSRQADFDCLHHDAQLVLVLNRLKTGQGGQNHLGSTPDYAADTVWCRHSLQSQDPQRLRRGQPWQYRASPRGSSAAGGGGPSPFCSKAGTGSCRAC